MTNDERKNITLKNKTYFRYKFECDYIAPVIIESGSRLPVTKTFDIYGHCGTCELKIFEGEYIKPNNIRDTKIFGMPIKITKGVKKGIFGIKITVNIDESGILSFSLLDRESNETKIYYLKNKFTSEVIDNTKTSLYERLQKSMIEKGFLKKRLRNYVNSYIDMLGNIKLDSNKCDVVSLEEKLHNTLSWLSADHCVFAIKNKQKEIEQLVHEIFEYTIVKETAV
ncbi:hypothetical protein B4U80_14424 [Leptotrombidium deliense]|uniref:Uncharacterized protein n=1 Tax=Leptotrombidium deliense TaxID=299467 RepID=A0A443RVS4_9ACAR|nr:hypothetical protein B4U80_14424 [Leptotrombidium deliense]